MAVTWTRKRRIAVLLSMIALLYFSRNKLDSVRPIKNINDKLKQMAVTPWKILFGGYILHYFLSHSLSLFGFGEADLPEQHYHPDYVKVRKVFTGLDAGIVASLHVRPQWLRQILALALGGYFIIFNKRGENRMHRFHNQATIEGIRACWTKARHPFLWRLTKLKEKTRIKIHRRRITIDPVSILNLNATDENLVPINVYLYFQGTDEELSNAKQMVINYPGGGFVTMNHLHHESYVQKWANYLHIPFISVDYRKAPEDKYPAGFNDSFYVYRCIVETNGAILGIHSPTKLKIALVGDSAGGNFVAAVTCRAIVEEMKVPDGLLLAYPLLDCNFNLLRPTNDVQDFYERNHTNSILRYSALPGEIKEHQQGDALKSQEETPLNSYVESTEIKSILKSAALDLKAKKGSKAYSAFNREELRGIMRNRGASMAPWSSRIQYINDGVLPVCDLSSLYFYDLLVLVNCCGQQIKYLLALADAYLPTNGDVLNDFYLSPLRAPFHILAKFPTTRLHVGSVDPLVDDARRFAAVLKYANSKIDVQCLEWDGLSHAYLQCPSFLLRQARYSVELSVQWMSQMLGVEVMDKESLKFDIDERNDELHDATDDFAFLRSRI